MDDEVGALVTRSRRYRGVDEALVRRLVAEEVRRGGSAAVVAKRVKRRLHQSVGAFRGALDATRILAPIRAAWTGEIADPAFRGACQGALRRHASTAERARDLPLLFSRIWDVTGRPPHTLLDLGCGLGPLALPWMGLAPRTVYRAMDADEAVLSIVDAFLDLVAQPHAVTRIDLAADVPHERADAALLLKLVPTLDRQDPAAAARLLHGLRVRHAVLSFPRRSLGGHAKGMERTYRSRAEELAAEGAARSFVDVSVPGELAFVLELGRE
jgi:16S rRNA (guanine(1405)-N(7))-methyltransferase